MKIVQINESLNQAGGQERYFFELIEGLRELDHEVYVMGFGQEEKNTENMLILKDSKYKIGKYAKRFLFDPGAYFRVRNWLKEINPDIIHIHGDHKSTLAVLLACGGYKIVKTMPNAGVICPTTWCVTKDDLKICKGGVGWKCYSHKCIPITQLPVFYGHFSFRNWLMKKIVKKFISPNNQLKQFVEEQGFSGKDIFVSPYTINLERSKSEKKEKIYDILFLGRLDKEKGVDFLLRAIEIIKKRHPKIRAAIVGGGPELENLKQLSRELKIEENVEFIGKVPFDRVNHYYAVSKVFVMPSVYMEQLGMAGLEALVNEVPVVASNRGGIKDWCINGKTGLSIDPTKPEDIAISIERIMNDKNLANNLVKEGKELVKKFGKERQLNDILKVYDEILKSD